MSAAKILKSSMGAAVATLLSRILGLARVMLEAKVLGGGALASTWEFAFTIPNVFRRLLGEGALGTALIPLISHCESEKGIEEVKRNLGIIFTVLGIILTLIVVVISALAWVTADFFETLYIRNALKLLPLVMPYAFFICLIGIAGAVLNTRRVFFLPAMGALILNIFLIGTLILLGALKIENSEIILKSLGIMLLWSGVLHLLLMIFLMYYYRIPPNFHWFKSQQTQVIKELFALALPGIIGGAGLQISLLIDRSLALKIGPQALPALSYTERIVYLPVGVFAISIGSVLMADMSKSAALRNYQEMIDDMMLGLRHVLFLCVPMTIFVMFFREELIRVLFLRGNFTISDLHETSWALLFYTMGIPFFCATKVILPAFFARKEMKKPMYISLAGIGVNIVLNLILMWPMRQGGLALATVISAIFNNQVLLYFLKKDGFGFSYKTLFVTGEKSLAGALIAGMIYAIPSSFSSYFPDNFIMQLLLIGIKIFLFMSIYLVAMKLMKSEEVGEFLALVKKRIKK